MLTLTEKKANASTDDDGPTVMVLAKTRPKPARIEASKIPARWRDGTARFTVKPGANEADFELTREERQSPCAPTIAWDRSGTVRSRRVRSPHVWRFLLSSITQ
jgi:hypothetical protein